MFLAEVGRRVAEDRRLAAEVLQTVPIDQPDLFATAAGSTAACRAARAPPRHANGRAAGPEEGAAMADLFSLAAAEEAQGRRRQMLRTAFGPTIAAALADPTVIEVMVNPDGKLWIERATVGRQFTGERIGSAEAERIIRLVAAHVRREVHDKAPIVSAELPETGERFEGVMPPVAPAPCFAVRKPADVLYRLADYVAARIMSARASRRCWRSAVRERKNILVVGGTSSGKTTLVNALLAEVADLDERVVILEDTRELKCAAADCVALRTKPGVASLADLVRSTLRLRPDRIIVGEVRGPEALDMLKAWNTGHPGGITTVHANSAPAGLYRLEQLVQEAVVTVPRDLIVEAIDIVVFLGGRGASRRVETLLEVASLDADGEYVLRSARPAGPAYRVKGAIPCGAVVSCRSRRAYLAAALAGGLRRPDGGQCRPCRRLRHAVGSAAAAHPGIDRGPGRQGHRRRHHHRHGPQPRLRRHGRRPPPPDPDRVRPLHRLRRHLVLPVVLLLRRRRADRLTGVIHSCLDNRHPFPASRCPCTGR